MQTYFTLDNTDGNLLDCVIVIYRPENIYPVNIVLSPRIDIAVLHVHK